MSTVVASERTQAVWEAVIERCCGLDVHQKTMTACLLAGALDQQPGETLRCTCDRPADSTDNAYSYRAFKPEW